MKTHIIHLDRTDDAISVRDKMSWTKAGRILLVWQGQSNPLGSRFNMVAIARHARDLGVQLALVTPDLQSRTNARSLGISVFSSVEIASSSAWSSLPPAALQPERNSLRPDLELIRQLIRPSPLKLFAHPALRTASFGLVALSIFALAIFILPSARVELVSQVMQQSLKIEISTGPAPDSSLAVGSHLPPILREVIVEGSGSLAATGSSTIPDQFAHGSVLVENHADRAVQIPPGWTVSTAGKNPIRFINTAQASTSIEAGKTTVISVLALVPGSAGNLPSSTITVIEGQTGNDLSVSNPNPMLGGTDAPVPAPSAADLRLLRSRLIEALRQQALTVFQNSLVEGDVLLKPSIKFVELLSEKSEPAEGEPSSQLQLSLRARFQVQLVTAGQLSKLAEPQLDAQITPGYVPTTDPVVLTRLTEPSLMEDGSYHWTIEVQRKIQAVILPALLQRVIQPGSTIRTTQSALKTQAGVQEVQVLRSPAWWPWMPFLSMRIQLVQAAGQ